MRIKIAVFNNSNPWRDYIYTCELPENQTPEQVIDEINNSLKDCHCELVNLEPENTRSQPVLTFGYPVSGLSPQHNKERTATMKKFQALSNQHRQESNMLVYDTLRSPNNLKNRVYMQQKIKNLSVLIDNERKMQNDNSKNR